MVPVEGVQLAPVQNLTSYRAAPETAAQVRVTRASPAVASLAQLKEAVGSGAEGGAGVGEGVGVTTLKYLTSLEPQSGMPLQAVYRAGGGVKVTAFIWQVELPLQLGALSQSWQPIKYSPAGKLLML